MRILTYCRHEPYVCLLAKTGHHFDVYEPYVPSLGKVRTWMTAFRPVPANVRLVSREAMIQNVHAGAYDAVVCHDGSDLSASLAFDVPKVLVFHNGLNWGAEDETRNGITREQIRATYEDVIPKAKVHVVFISESKRDSWALSSPSEVVIPGIDLEDCYGYRGELPAALRVASQVLDNLMQGGMKLMYITWGFPLQIIGHNDAHLPHARPSTSWEDLKEQLRSHRVYVNTTEEPYEDGYNLSLLEAMATGMPVIATPSRTSPIVDGYNGFVSDDLVLLRQRLQLLLGDRGEAARLGENARRTVAERFSLADFVGRWNTIFARVAGMPDRSASADPVSGAADCPVGITTGAAIPS